MTHNVSSFFQRNPDPNWKYAGENILVVNSRISLLFESFLYLYPFPSWDVKLKKAEKDKFLVNSLPTIDWIKILSSIFLANGAFLYLANP